MHYYSTDIPQTASELFDGELVIANYDSGLYFSVTAAGTLVWQGLRHGLAVEQVADWLAARYGNPAGMAAQVTGFVATLAANGLVVPIETPTAGPALPELPAELGEFGVERFEDLQELLLLDPVHDVAEAGWPVRADTTD